MNSDLIVITFDDEDEADKVLDAMPSMRKEPLLNLEQAVMITRNKVGKVRLHQRRDLAPQGQLGGESVLSLLSGLIFGHSLEMIWGISVPEVTCALTERGFDEHFLSAVDGSLKNNSSAIMFWTRREDTGDPDEILKILKLFKGKIHQTTLSPQAEAYLLDMLQKG